MSRARDKRAINTWIRGRSYHYQANAIAEAYLKAARAYDGADQCGSPGARAWGLRCLWLLARLERYAIGDA